MKTLRSARAVSLASFAAVLAACSSPASSESTGETGNDLVQIPKEVPLPAFLAPIHDASARATDSTVAVTYHRQTTSAPATVVLSGPDGVATTNELFNPRVLVLGAGDAHTISFTGLDACTPYRYTIKVGATSWATGAIHTVDVGGGDCPSHERIGPSKTETFRGVHHDRYDHDWCTRDSWSTLYKTYPLGSGWLSREHAGDSKSLGAARIGYQHFYDGGSGSFPCGEELVDVYRAALDFELTPLQLRRATTGTFAADVQSYGPNGAHVAGACTPEISAVLRTSYPPTAAVVNALNDYGASWANVLGTFNWWGLEWAATMMPLLSPTPGTQATADLTSRLGPDIRVGLAMPRDGFGSMNDSRASFAQDNAVCLTDMTNVGIDLTYAALPPDSPSGCSATFGCGVFVATCTGSRDVFQLHRVGNDGSDTVVSQDANIGRAGEPMLTDSPASYGGAKSYYVCTASGGSKECTTSLDVTLKPAASCTLQGGGGGGGVHFTP